MTWKLFLRFLELRDKVVTLTTLLLTTLSVFWVQGSLPWSRTALLFLAVITADLGISAFHSFRTADTDKPGLAVIAGLFFLTFSSVLTLFLVVWTGLPVLFWCALGLSLAVVSKWRHYRLKPLWADVLMGLAVTVLWFLVFSVLSVPGIWPSDYWWKIPLSSVPAALFVASLRSLNQDHTNLALTLPLLSYASLVILSVAAILPWTFYAVSVVGPALSIPFWRKKAHPKNGFQSYLVFFLVSIMGWALGVWVP